MGARKNEIWRLATPSIIAETFHRRDIGNAIGFRSKFIPAVCGSNNEHHMRKFDSGMLAHAWQLVEQKKLRTSFLDPIFDVDSEFSSLRSSFFCPDKL